MNNNELPDDVKDYTQFNLGGGATDVLWCLFKHGPTWDGNLPSKQGRDELIALGLAQAYDGWQTLTAVGLAEAISRGYDKRKGW